MCEKLDKIYYKIDKINDKKNKLLSKLEILNNKSKRLQLQIQQIKYEELKCLENNSLIFDKNKLIGITEGNNDFGRIINIDNYINGKKLDEVGVLTCCGENGKMTFVLDKNVDYKIDPNFNKNKVIDCLILLSKNNFKSNYPVNLVVMNGRIFKYVGCDGYLEIENTSYSDDYYMYKNEKIDNILGFPIINDDVYHHPY